MHNFNKRYIPVFIIILAAVIYGIYYILQTSVLKSGLVVSGTIEAKEIHLGVVTGGIVERMLVDEGDSVKTDQLLAIVKNVSGGASGSIRSPIDGVVLTRTVDPGNAVAASLQAVTLFTVAEDLAQLRLQVNVDEADVGSVKVGQKARFTVSAYPARKYPATITRVAYGSTTTDNVVTYVTYLEVDNSDLSLRPGMTASATITSTERQDVLLVPNTALRFTPAPAAGAAKEGGGIVSTLLPRMPRSGARKTAGGAGAARQVWVLRDAAPVALDVTAGISDGRMTEIIAGELQAGMLVITDQRAAGTAP